MPQLATKPQPITTTTAAPATAPPVAKPAAAKKPAKAKKATPPPPAEEPQPTTAEIVYPVVKAEVCVLDKAITAERAKDILGWETEAQFTTRSMAENPGTKPEAHKFGDMYMLLDAETTKTTGDGKVVPTGSKVRCWRNLDNRPFDLDWSMTLAHDILNKNWAGPLTIPGETINGETVTISRTAQVKSGQHRLVALVLASQMWEKNRLKWDKWETEPVLETIVITGISDSKKVAMTVDNVKPRSESDVFYTSALFDTLVPSERKECSRMLAAAADFLWKRTEAKGYKTHSEIVGFVDRHVTLVKCLEHLFVENSAASGRKISNLSLSAGQCSALCYIMGSSGGKTDGDVYRNGLPPSEKGLDWSLLDQAKAFFALLGASDDFTAVRKALNALVESTADSEVNQGLGGRLDEKLAILAKAWGVFKEGVPIMDVDVKLAYNSVDHEGNPLPDGKLSLLDVADFGGIDCPPRPIAHAPRGASTDGSADGTVKMTEAEMEAEKERVRKQKAIDAVEAIKKLRAAAPKK